MRSMVEGFFLSVHQARQLRRRMSPSEIRLWRMLRLRPSGLQFRRQHPFEPFVLDFFCKAAGLAIEVDGVAHDFGNNPDRDVRRDTWLKTQGVETMRIAAIDVRRNLEGVLIHIVNRCLERTPTTALRAVPLPVK